MPITKTAAANQTSPGRTAQPTAPSSATAPAIAMVSRSPILPTNHPAGRFPNSVPTTIADATSAAVGMSAPRWVAMTGMRGTMAPSPSENTNDGRYTIGPYCLSIPPMLVTGPTLQSANPVHRSLYARGKALYGACLAYTEICARQRQRCARRSVGP